MGTVTRIFRPKFSVGELVHHRRFNYRGVVIDVDARYEGTDEWYDQVARSRPPKDKPWYHVMVDGAAHFTYVAERHLEPDPSEDPVRHPMLWQIFVRREGARYIRSEQTN